MNRAALAGLGTWLPENVVTNDELARRLDTSDEWIRTRTGIRQRHVIGPGQSTGDLAVEAGRRALKSAAPTRPTWSWSPPAPRTGRARPPPRTWRAGSASTGVPAFDIAAVCTGFVYALGMASAVIGSGVPRGACWSSARTPSPPSSTPRTAPPARCSATGAGAVLLRPGDPGEPGALGGLDLGSDGSRSELIEVPAGGSRQKASGRSAEETGPYFTMRGRAVFSEAVRRMATSVETAAQRLGWAPGDIDRVVLHQANARILAAVADRMGLPARRFVSNIGRVGNTVAASIPLALADGVIEGELRPGQRVVLGGFGGGLTWGAMGLRWPDITPV